MYDTSAEPLMLLEKRIAIYCDCGESVNRFGGGTVQNSVQNINNSLPTVQNTIASTPTQEF